MVASPSVPHVGRLSLQYSGDRLDPNPDSSRPDFPLDRLFENSVTVTCRYSAPRGCARLHADCGRGGKCGVHVAADDLGDRQEMDYVSIQGSVVTWMNKRPHPTYPTLSWV